MAMDFFIPFFYISSGMRYMGTSINLQSVYRTVQIDGLLFPPEFYLSGEFSEVKMNLLDGLLEEFE